MTSSTTLGSSPQPWSVLGSWFDRIRTLFEEAGVRRRVFGRAASALGAEDVRSTITSVALVNAVLAGLPGKLGVGVVVCQALELWMAWRIARHVGLSFTGPQALAKALLSWGGVVVLVFQGMRLLINGLSTLLSVLPFSPMAIAELVATDVMGVVFVIGFQEMARNDSFRVPARSMARLFTETKALVKHQVGTLGRVLSKRQLVAIGRRLSAYLKGEVVPAPTTTMDAVVAASMASMVAGESAALDGPVGRLFVQSVRDLYPDLAHADSAAMAERMAGYTQEQMPGVLANVKGRLFERMVEARTNGSAEGLEADLHADRCHPSTDLVVRDSASGETFAVSLKATDDPAYVERALARYPEDRIWVTDEVAAKMDDPRVTGTGITDEEMEAVTQENFDRLLDATPATTWDYARGSATGSGLGAAVVLWPFLMARLRGRIGDALWQAVARKVLGHAAARACINFVGLFAFGPIFAWYLLAKTCPAAARWAQDSELGGGGNA